MPSDDLYILMAIVWKHVGMYRNRSVLIKKTLTRRHFLNLCDIHTDRKLLNCHLKSAFIGIYI